MFSAFAIPVIALSTLVAAMSAQCVRSYSLFDGVGDPWGVAIDQSGNIWFAEAGCDFEVNCTGATPPGQLGVLHRGADAPRFYTLPAMAGNQPIFVEPDASGSIWFTTPNNNLIGEFDPATETFVGQWAVTPGTGPWDLVFAQGALWYTERFVSAVGRFDPVAHTHVDFQTPSPNAHPYGIAAGGSRVWFTENNPSLARIAALDTARSNLIDEYELQPQPNFSITPHMLSIDDAGNVWWSGGWERSIGKLDPARAQAGSCRAVLANCIGVNEYSLPAPPATCAQSHVSGIAAQSGSVRVWLTNSLTGEVGFFDQASGAFTLRQVHDCNAHAHDGLAVDATGRVWWTEEFRNALNTMSPPG
jgi:streptogramin lyase